MMRCFSLLLSVVRESGRGFVPIDFCKSAVYFFVTRSPWPVTNVDAKGANRALPYRLTRSHPSLPSTKSKTSFVALQQPYVVPGSCPASMGRPYSSIKRCWLYNCSLSILSGSVRCAPGSVEMLCCGYGSTDVLADEGKKQKTTRRCDNPPVPRSLYGAWYLGCGNLADVVAR